MRGGSVVDVAQTKGDGRVMIERCGEGVSDIHFGRVKESNRIRWEEGDLCISGISKTTQGHLWKLSGSSFGLFSQYRPSLAFKSSKKRLLSADVCFTLISLLSQLKRLYYFIVLTRNVDEVTEHEL